MTGSIYKPDNLSRLLSRDRHANGDGGYKASGYEIARTIDLDRNGSSVLLVAVEEHNVSFLNAVQDAFGEFGIPYKKLHANVSRLWRKVRRPTMNQVGEAVTELKRQYESDVMAIGYDDTILLGIRALTLYGFLKDCQAAFEGDERRFGGVKLAALADRRGVTDEGYCWNFMAEHRIDKDKARTELMSRGGLDRQFMDYLHASLARVPNTEEVLRRTIVL